LEIQSHLSTEEHSQPLVGKLGKGARSREQFLYFFFAGTLGNGFSGLRKPNRNRSLPTFYVLSERSLFRIPFFFSCIAFSTFLDAFFP